MQVQGGNFSILTTGIEFDRALGQCAEVLNVSGPHQVVQPLQKFQVVMGDLVQATRPVRTGSASPPKAALVHLVQGSEHYVHAGIISNKTLLSRSVD
jgi:hypothetical protein